MTALRLKPVSPTLSIALPLSIIAALTATAAFQAGIIGSDTRPVASVDAPQTVVIPTAHSAIVKTANISKTVMPLTRQCAP